MIDGCPRVLTLTSAVGAGLVAGIFFAFSSFVMKVLDRLPPAQGIAAMQSINITVINPLFMAAFFGTAAGCVILAIFSLVTWQRPGAVFLLVGCVLYLFDTILVTIVFNVPKNKALASVTPADPDGASLWSSCSSLVGSCTWQVRKDAGRSLDRDKPLEAEDEL